MKAVSLMAGVGVTDMCLTQQGVQVIVASDKNHSSMAVHQYNHQYADPSHNPICVIGDLANTDIQNQIITAAKTKLDPEETLDLLTLFVPPAKNLKEILAAVSNIARCLYPKIIYMDALSYNSYCQSNISNLINSTDIRESYYGFSTNYNLNEFGVSNKSKRQAVLFLNKAHFSENIFYATKHRATTIDSIKAPVIKELFAPISLLKEQTLLPLHQPTAIIKQSIYNEQFYQGLAQLNPEESLFKKNGNAHSLIRYKNKLRGIKIDENKIFPFTLSERAITDWEWAIHPTESRGFTPLELCFIATLHLVPFELAPESANTPLLGSTIIQRITNATAPAYLIRFLREILFPILEHENMQPLELKFAQRYHHAHIENKVFYLGSCYPFKPRTTNSHTLLFSEVDVHDKENATRLFHHRERLINHLKSEVKKLREKNLNSNAYSDAIIDFIQTLKQPFKIVRCNNVHYRSCMQKETKLCDVLVYILAKSTEVPLNHIEELKHYFLNKFVIPMQNAKAQSLPSIAVEADYMIDAFVIELNKKYKSFAFFNSREYEAAEVLTKLSSSQPLYATHSESQQIDFAQDKSNFLHSALPEEKDLENNGVLKKNLFGSLPIFFKPQKSCFNNENLHTTSAQNTIKKRKKPDIHSEENPPKHAQVSVTHFFDQFRREKENLSQISIADNFEITKMG